MKHADKLKIARDAEKAIDRRPGTLGAADIERVIEGKGVQSHPVTQAIQGAINRHVAALARARKRRSGQRGATERAKLDKLRTQWRKLAEVDPFDPAILNLHKRIERVWAKIAK